MAILRTAPWAALGGAVGPGDVSEDLADRRRRGALALAAGLLALAACSGPGASAVVSRPGFAGVARAVTDGRAPDTTSVLVMQGGAIVHEAYFAGATIDTLHDPRSVGKSVTALAVGAAIDRGLVRLDTPVFATLAARAPVAHAGPVKDAITVEDLLTMSSALACDDDDPRSVGNERGMYPQASWVRWAVDLPVAADYRRDDTGRGPWRYCTAGTLLLGQVLEVVSGQPADRFIAEQVLTPLGITRWQFERSPTGEVMTGGMLRLRTRDLATLGWLIRARGRHGATQVVSSAFVDAALTPPSPGLPQAGRELRLPDVASQPRHPVRFDRRLVHERQRRQLRRGVPAARRGGGDHPHALRPRSRHARPDRAPARSGDLAGAVPVARSSPVTA
jgi:CubicO group peptidase (beta-lactamase class C family)